MEADTKWTCPIANGHVSLAQGYDGPETAEEWKERATKKHSLALNKPEAGPTSFPPDIDHTTLEMGIKISFYYLFT